MVLNNLKKYMLAMTEVPQSNETFFVDISKYGIRESKGSIASSVALLSSTATSSQYRFVGNTSAFAGWKFAIGEGASPVSADDYQLNTEIQDTYWTFDTSWTVVVGQSGEIIIRYTVNIVRKSTGSDTVIKEIGFYKPIYTSSTSANQKIFMIREVLSEPIVVHTNGTVQITYDVIL